MDAIYFDSPAAFRAWLAENHDKAKEVLVGFHKKHTGKLSLTWEESVREALCFGWIDGIGKSVDADRYTIRFTPRRPGSNWSRINIKHVEELIQEGRMQPAGLQAFAARTDTKSSIYSYEENSHVLDETYESQFRANSQAWDFFQTQAASYRRTATHWVMSAKKEETRTKRLAELIEVSRSGQRLGQLSRPPKT